MTVKEKIVQGLSSSGNQYSRAYLCGYDILEKISVPHFVTEEEQAAFLEGIMDGLKEQIAREKVMVNYGND